MHQASGLSLTGDARLKRLSIERAYHARMARRAQLALTRALRARRARPQSGEAAACVSTWLGERAASSMLPCERSGRADNRLDNERAGQ